MWGIKYTTASASQLIYAAQPILTIIISSLLWKEKFQIRTILGVAIGLIGIAIIIISSALEKGETISGGLIGNLAMIVAMAGWLFYILLSKKYLKNFSVVEIGSTSIIVSLLVSTFFMLIQLKIDNKVIILSYNLILACLYLGLFGTFATYLLMQYSIKYLSPLTVNLTSYIQPVTTAFLAILLLGEKITPTFLLGGVLVFLGVFTSATLEFVHSRRK
jgi:drug/metabolite transporter (DMT)-like permease